MTRLRSGLLLALLLCESGCGTIGSLMAGTEEGERTLIYGGVRVNAVVVAHMFSGESVHGLDVFWIGLVYFLDLPLSAVADTVTLPYTVGVEIWGRSGKLSRE